MDYCQEFTQEEQAQALDNGLCPRCKGPILDLRGAGFNGAQVGQCFMFGTSSWECTQTRPGPRNGIKMSDWRA